MEMHGSRRSADSPAPAGEAVSYMRFQVGETSFAVRCRHPVLARWLQQACHAFPAEDAPQTWLALDLEGHSLAAADDGERRQDGALAISRLTADGRADELRLKVASEDPAHIPWLALQLCLRLAVASKRPPDLLLHAAGVARGSRAYAFTGPAGAGKSTVCRLSAETAGSSILHDDVLMLAKAGGGFRAHGTPLRGEFQGIAGGYPLRALFVLKQDREDYAVGIRGWRAARQLARQLLLPLTATDEGLAPEPGPSLELLLTLVDAVPVYELHFRRGAAFWQCIERIPELAAETPGICEARGEGI